MKKLIFIFLLTTIFCQFFNQPVFSQIEEHSAPSAILKNSYVQEDQRIEILKNFLKKYNSPLFLYAQEFIEAADFYGIDWKLLPAISGVESTFGKRIPKDSFNAYGWNNGAWKFSSWEDSIWYVTSQLKAKYINRGANTPFQIGKIYASSPCWSARVNFFIKKIEDFSNFPLSL